MAYNSLKRGLVVLEQVANSKEGLSVTQISQLLRCDMGSASRLLSSLQDMEFLARKGSRGSFVLGNRVIAMGLSAAARLDEAEEARPFVEELSAAFNQMGYFAVRVQDEVIPVVSHSPPNSFQFRSCLGSRYALHSSAAGKNYLAHTTADELEQLLGQLNLQRFTKNTLTTTAKLKRELALVKRQGYSVDNEETELGVKCISAPVFDFQGQVAGALGITGLASILTSNRIRALSASIKKLASQLSQRLGFTESTVAWTSRGDAQKLETDMRSKAVG